MTELEKRELLQQVRLTIREELARAGFGSSEAPPARVSRRAVGPIEPEIARLRDAHEAAWRRRREIADEIRARGRRPDARSFPELRAAEAEERRLFEELRALDPPSPEEEQLSRDFWAALEHRSNLRRAIVARAKEAGEKARPSLDPKFRAADQRVKELKARWLGR